MPPVASHAYEDALASLSALAPELFTVPAEPDPATGPAAAAPVRRKFSLTEIGHLAAALGNPQGKFPSVLIAGTNGKGSTAATLAAIAQAAGLRTGLYTSPHLARVNERIKLLAPTGHHEMGAPQPGMSPALSLPEGLDPETPIAGNPDIPDETFARLYFRVHDAAQQLVLDHILENLPSYFELLTALAFLYFAEPDPGAAPVDLAILEVGMGGRLDATNLVWPILSVITDIALDHQEWLGNTIAEIAREKAGILRPNGVLITLPQHPAANQVIGEIATELGVRGVNAAEYMPQMRAQMPIRTRSSPDEPYQISVLGQTVVVDSPLKGAHQHRNVALAIASAAELAKRFPITPEAIARGIRQTHWPARLESILIAGHPEFLLDVAHNPAGAWALRAALADTDEPGGPGSRSESLDSPRQVLIFSCLRDKPLREMTQILFPIFDHILLAPIRSPRAAAMEDLIAAAEATSVPFTAAQSVEEALDEALDAARAQPARTESDRSKSDSTGGGKPAGNSAAAAGRIVISGSLYLVGEARTALLARKAAGAGKATGA